MVAVAAAVTAGTLLAGIPAWVLVRPDEAILGRLSTWAARITAAHELRAAEDARVHAVLRDGQVTRSRQSTAAAYLARRAGRPTVVAARIRTARRPVRTAVGR